MLRQDGKWSIITVASNALPLQHNKQTLFSLHLLDTKIEGRQKVGRLTGRTQWRSGAGSHRSASTQVLRHLSSSGLQADRLVVHHPDQVVPCPPNHGSQELCPRELVDQSAVMVPSQSSSSGSSKTDLRCPGWFQGFGVLPFPFPFGV